MLHGRSLLRRPSWSTVAVLAVLAREPERPLHGLAAARESHVPVGSIYPILARLERAGWVRSEWEQSEPTELARPRRRLYALTPMGVRAAADLFAELDGLGTGQRPSLSPGPA